MSLLGSASALRRIGQSAHLDCMASDYALGGWGVVPPPPAGHSRPDAVEGERVGRRRLPIAALAALAVLAVGCGGGTGTTATQAVIETVSPAAAADLIAAAPPGLVILDVRTPDEFAAGHLAGAVNLDFSAATFGDDLAALDTGAPYIFYCRRGNRSADAREMMRSLGFREVHEIAGGIDAWVAAGLPVEAP
jgi:phage shock protein E